MAAGKRVGKFTKLWVGGYELTTTGKSIQSQHTRGEAEVGGYTQDMQYLLGRADGRMPLNGLFSEDTGPTHTALKTVSQGELTTLCSFVIGDNATPTVGDPTFHLQANGHSQYSVTPDLNGAVGVDAVFAAKGTGIEYGVLLFGQSITANTDGTGVNNGASSANGGVGYAHITGLSAGDTITLLIEDSADNAAWATLITFTLDGSAIGAERIEVSGTVDQYVRATATVTGSGVSFPVMVALVRNP